MCIHHAGSDSTMVSGTRRLSFQGVACHIHRGGLNGTDDFWDWHGLWQERPCPMTTLCLPHQTLPFGLIKCSRMTRVASTREELHPHLHSCTCTCTFTRTCPSSWILLLPRLCVVTRAGLWSSTRGAWRDHRLHACCHTALLLPTWH